MTTVGSIPTGRISDALIRQRLLGQLQAAQAQVSRLQQQISTGQKFTLASQGTGPALLGIALRDLIQRKEQSSANLTTAASYLDATESSLSSVSTLITDMRSLALQATGSGSTAAERQSALTTIDLTIDRMLQLANQNFRGRFLFSGARTSTAAFARQGNFIVYQGDANRLQTFSDLVNLIETNVTGDDAFGALSSQVLGTADLNPVASESTPLSQLRGGRGITAGSIAVSDGLYTSTVNIQGCVTLGDVARRLEKFPPGWDQQPPTGRTLRARVGPNGLEVALNGGNLSIGEVGGGSTAGELGLRTNGFIGPGPFIGGDVNPVLTRTTSLTDLFGARARAYLSPSGLNNDIVVQATSNGAAYNNVKVKLIDDGHLRAGLGLGAGSEVAQYLTAPTAAKAVLVLPGPSNDLLLTANTAGEAFNGVKIDIVDGGSIGDAAQASYDSGSKTLTLTIDGSGQTQIGTLMTAINGTGVFTAARDTSGSDPAIDNTATIPTGAFGANVANTFNTGSDANTLVVRIAPGASTANQIIAAINATSEFTARLDYSEANNNGAGVVFDSVTDAGTTAITFGGSGANFDQTSGIQLVNGGQTHTLSFGSARTIDDLLNAINGAGAGVVAQINAAGTGIDIRSALSGAAFSVGENGGATASQLGIRSFTTDTPLAELNFGAGVRTTGGVDFTITRRDGVAIPINLSGALTIGDVLVAINNAPQNLASGTPLVARLATVGNGIELVDDSTGTGTLSVAGSPAPGTAIDLGLIPTGQTTSAPPTLSGSSQILTGGDSHPVEVHGIFTALLRLRQAIADNDDPAVQRAVAMLDESGDRVTATRGEIGVRRQTIDLFQTQLQDEKLELEKTRSQQLDVDLPAVISQLVASQTAFEAALRAAGSVSQLTLLSFL